VARDSRGDRNVESRCESSVIKMLSTRHVSRGGNRRVLEACTWTLETNIQTGWNLSVYVDGRQQYGVIPPLPRRLARVVCEMKRKSNYCCNLQR